MSLGACLVCVFLDIDSCSKLTYFKNFRVRCWKDAKVLFEASTTHDESMFPKRRFKDVN